VCDCSIQIQVQIQMGISQLGITWSIRLLCTAMRCDILAVSISSLINSDGVLESDYYLEVKNSNISVIRQRLTLALPSNLLDK
jgi:hypothetical protein